MQARLYHDLAHLWPILSPPEDYAAEARAIRRVLREAGLPDGKPSLVEFGAGGGHSLHHLQHHFHCTAVDLAPAMLGLCRQLNPEIQTVVGDMRHVRLGRIFDVVLIHDAIDYLLTEADLRATFATAAVHLASGGMLLVAPTYTRETFADGDFEIDTPGSPRSSNVGFDLVYTTLVTDPTPTDTTFNLTLTYQVTDHDTGQTQTIEDHHTCGLFAEEDWLRLLDETGFDVSIDDGDLPWTLFVARKR